jgi:hypothetical protein
MGKDSNKIDKKKKTNPEESEPKEKKVVAITPDETVVQKVGPSKRKQKKDKAQLKYGDKRPKRVDDSKL